MGEETSAEGGGDTKPDANKNNDNSHGRQQKWGRGGKNKRNKNNTSAGDTEAKKFTGATEGMGVFTSSLGRDKTLFTESLKSTGLYANKNYDCSRTAASITKGVLNLPDEPDEDDFKTEVVHKDGSKTMKLTEGGKIKFSKRVDRWERERAKVEENLRCMYSIVWNNCDSTVQAAIKEATDFEDMDNDMDVLKLLKKIEVLSFKGTATDDTFRSIYTMLKAVFNTVQTKKSNTTEFYEKFNNTIKAADELFGGTGKFLAVFDPLFISTIAIENGEELTGVNAIDSTKKKDYAKQGRERMAAMMFLLGADRKRYGDPLKLDYGIDAINPDAVRITVFVTGFLPAQSELIPM